MIRAVVDVNVFVSALISRESVAARLVRHTAERQFELVLSPRLLDELVAVARRPRLRQHFTVDEADRLIRDLWALAVRVDDTGQVPAATRDPDDDYLVALVRAAHADVLVTGDHDLLELEDLPVLSPRAFVDRLETDIDAGPR